MATSAFKPESQPDWAERLRRAVASLEVRVAVLERTLGGSLSASHITLDKEHDRIMQKMDAIEGTYSGLQRWRDKDRIEWRNLRQRRDQIRKQLGITA
jgi:hypothetical protein